jgi:hypothetical protein
MWLSTYPGAVDSLNARPAPSLPLAYALKMHDPRNVPVMAPSLPCPGPSFTCFTGRSSALETRFRSPTPVILRRSRDAPRAPLSPQAIKEAIPDGILHEFLSLECKAGSELGSSALISTSVGTLSNTSGLGGAIRDIIDAHRSHPAFRRVLWYRGMRKSAAGLRFRRKQRSPPFRSSTKCATAAEACVFSVNKSLHGLKEPESVGNEFFNVGGLIRFSTREISFQLRLSNKLVILPMISRIGVDWIGVRMARLTILRI